MTVIYNCLVVPHWSIGHESSRNGLRGPCEQRLDFPQLV